MPPLAITLAATAADMLIRLLSIFACHTLLPFVFTPALLIFSPALRRRFDAFATI